MGDVVSTIKGPNKASFSLQGKIILKINVPCMYCARLIRSSDKTILKRLF